VTIGLRVGSASDVGRARRANEDALLRDEEAALFAVADGMGGHRAGDVASTTALDAVRAGYAGGAALDEAVRAANTAVFDKAQADTDLRGMGTTVTAVHVEGERALLAHVGDSRAYLLRDGQLTRITDDHSLVEELVREGRLSPEEAAVHPQRSIVTRAVGVEETVEVDTYEVDLRPGDRLLLCSDGLTSMVNESGIARVLRDRAEPQAAADALVVAANAAGGDDNITALVLDVEGDGDSDDLARGLAASQALGPVEDGPTGELTTVDAGHEPPVAVLADTAGGRRLPRLRRVLLYAVPVVLVFAVAVGALAWYGRTNYFVALDTDRSVALFHGVPGGFLVWDPTLVHSTDLTSDDLTDYQLGQIEDGKRFSNREDAERYLGRLERDVASTTTTTTRPTTTPTTTPTSTTTPRTPTTVSRAGAPTTR